MKLRCAVLASFVIVLGAGSASASTEFVYYIGSTSVAGSGDIHELSSADGTKWTDNDLTAGRGFSAAASNSTVGFVTEGNGARHIFYSDPNGNIIEVSNIGGTWAQVSLSTNVGSSTAGAPGLAPTMTAFGDAFGQHVYYVGRTGDLIHLFTNSCELSCANGSWKMKDLTSAPKPGNVMSSFTDAQGDHIFYFGCPAGTPCQSDLIEVSQAGGPATSIQVQDLSRTVPGIPNGENASIRNGELGQVASLADQWGEHIFYNDGDVHQIYCSGGCSDQQLTWGGSLSSGSFFYPMAGSTDVRGGHVFYFSSQPNPANNLNNDLNELFYDGSSWSTFDLTSIAPLAVLTRSSAMVSYPDQLGEHLFYTDAKGQLNEYTTAMVVYHTPSSRGVSIPYVALKRANVVITGGNGPIKPIGSSITGFSQ